MCIRQCALLEGKCAPILQCTNCHAQKIREANRCNPRENWVLFGQDSLVAGTARARTHRDFAILRHVFLSPKPCFFGLTVATKSGRLHREVHTLTHISLGKLARAVKQGPIS